MQHTCRSSDDPRTGPIFAAPPFDDDSPPTLASTTYATLVTVDSLAGEIRDSDDVATVRVVDVPPPRNAGDRVPSAGSK